MMSEAVNERYRERNSQGKAEKGAIEELPR